MEYWSNGIMGSGIMKYWVSKTDDDLIFNSDPCHPYKIRSHSADSSTPAFQYSSIPLYSLTIKPNFSGWGQRTRVSLVEINDECI